MGGSGGGMRGVRVGRLSREQHYGETDREERGLPGERGGERKGPMGRGDRKYSGDAPRQPGVGSFAVYQCIKTYLFGFLTLSHPYSSKEVPTLHRYP